MQSRGVIRFFTVVLLIVCVYQLLFTFFAKQVESDAAANANGDVDKETAYLDSMKNVEVYPLFGHTYKKCQENQINLGLDLKGGMNVTLEVSVIDLIKGLANNSQDPKFLAAIDKAVEMQKDSQDDFVTLFGKAFNEDNPNGKLAAIFATRDLKEKVTFESSNEEVLEVLKTQSNIAIDNAFEVLRKRIDKFGVAQPNIRKLETAGRILVELPGVKDKKRVRKLLQGTAKLEFWETYETRELIPYLNEAFEVLGDTKETVIDSSKTATNEPDTSATGNSNDLTAAVAGAAGTDSLAKRTINPLADAMIINVYPQENGQSYIPRGPVVGYALIQDTAEVMELLKRKDVASIFPRDLKLLWGVKAENRGFTDKIERLPLIAIKIKSRTGVAQLEGDVVKDAYLSYVQGSPAVSMSMNPEGARTWKRITRENQPPTPDGDGRSVAVVLDDYVYSYPEVRGEIPNGQTQISGSFTLEEATDLVNVLKAGKLPAPARIVEDATVGASLGEESTRNSILALIISLIVVMLYMMFYYGKAGWVSVVALFVNIFLVLGVLASLGATLSLAGMAGIVLTIGMSVDANVLIYERIREELRAGSALHKAIEDGYKNAYSSIIDANVTTLLTGIILFLFGSGPIQGFATTLIIGILTSLFSAILITRLIFWAMLEKDKTISFSTKTTENAFSNVNINFIKNRKLYYVISGLIIAGGIASLATRGLNKGVDFVGGRNYKVEFTKEADISALRKSLTSTLQSAEVTTIEGGNRVKVTTKYLINENGVDVDDRVDAALAAGLSKVDKDFEVISSQKVGSTIADDIKEKSYLAIVFSLVVIFIYIVARFGNVKTAGEKNFGVKFAIGALAALTHDVLIVLSLFSILWGLVPFSLEIDQAFIAAILTVVGYSINDTVVVFDRIRERLGLLRKQDTDELVNGALNSTLSRTFNTSITVFFVILAIFLFGGDTIAGFSFALLVGIVVGTYSSLCIATPIMYDTIKKLGVKKKK